jgi:2-polyprenyl-3-methyl-5-hydroxy-6-metoxy-1,4-benzoquinol methylase
MSVAVLFPHYHHPAIEERYASWQSELLLRAADIHYYDPDEPGVDAISGVNAEFVLVIADPLLLPAPLLGQRLAALLGDAFAAVPVSNEAEHPKQRITAPVPYVTLRELETTADVIARENGDAVERVTWDASDPGAFVCRTSSLSIKTRMRQVLNGQTVVIARGVYVHRWSSMRGQARLDLLDRISPDAKSILEFGCGEAPLGAALKARQRCRVVGIELDPKAAAIARKRIDDVYEGDAREIVSILGERFDWMIGGDIVEHLDEPWSFLSDLRHISAPGGHLLLSLPNLANASVVNDLLHGRFDYVYMGLTCVGHLRFFTRRTIEEMLTIAGWRVESIEAQAVILSPAAEELINKLTNAGIEFSTDDLLAPGYYVTAVNG